MELESLHSGPLGLVVVPAVGGAMARFWSEAGETPLELLRPAPADAVARRDPWSMAGFPLVPWSNRIREGRFIFGGRAVSLAPNRPPERHAIHGLGFESTWTVEDRGPSRLALEHRHDGGAWPWPYRAVQRIALTPVALTLELALTNEGDTAMPAGLGWHPYFPCTDATRLTAGVAGMWLTDEEVMPLALATPPPADLGRGLLVNGTALDNVFTGWDGQAVVAWPERSAHLRITAGLPLGCLVVYAPPARAFFCVEPVSHVTDAFNLAARGRSDTGLLTVAPGETVRAAVTLTPEVSPADREGRSSPAASRREASP
jgi:aldose 1-epimerase